MRPKHTEYVSSVEENDKRNEKLKQKQCPHCHLVGFLVGHGCIWGYGEDKSKKVLRGWRKYCTNRNGRKGCGGTFQILLAGFLYHRQTPASKLWRLLEGIIAGRSIKSVWEMISAPLCLDTGYRLWKTFVRSQAKIRTLLCREKAPPKLNAGSPAGQVMEHIRQVFGLLGQSTDKKVEVSPIASFQVRFQTAFLSG